MQSSAEMAVEEPNKELLELVERDYDSSKKFIDDSLKITAAIRGWTVTVWGALLAVAINQRSWIFGAFAALVVLVFAILDGYHSAQYKAVLARARAIEDLWALRYKAIVRGSRDAELNEDFQAALDSHRFGLYRNFPRMRWRFDNAWPTKRDVKRMLPSGFFGAMYAAFLVIAIVVTVFVAVRGQAEETPPTNTAAAVLAIREATWALERGGP